MENINNFRVAILAKSVGLNDINISRGMQINSSSAVLQAAMEGHGVALARSVMVQKIYKPGV